MAAYNYKALGSSGKIVKGVLEGESERQVRSQLRLRQLKPVTVSVSSEAVVSKSNATTFSPTMFNRLFKPRISQSDLALITRQMATLVQSSMPLDEALTATAQQSRKPGIKTLMLQVRARVLEGYNLAYALGDFPQVFNEMYCSMVKAGEHAGFLGQVLEQLAEYTENNQYTQQKLKGAMIYPMVLMLLSVVVIAVLMVFVVPDLVGVFSHTQQELPALTKIVIMEFKRTPDECFDNLPDYPFKPNYQQVAGGEGGELRMHYVDEGPADGQAVLLMHGQPSWSYLYRKMIPLFVKAGYRVIAPDLIGFGKSDKPTERANYTYANHVAWVTGLLEAINLRDITLVCQDWGGLIGLRVAAENPDRFARIVTANTGLPDAKGVASDQFEEASKPMHAYYDSLAVPADVLEMGMAMAGDSSGMGFMHWVKYCAESKGFSPREVLNRFCGGTLSEDEQRAYGAPFPDESYLAGARQFPSLVPIMPDNPAITANRAAWAVFEHWDKPFLTAFSDSDPVTAGAHVRFQESVPGAQGQPHITIEGAGHFLQEQAPEELAAATMKLMADNPL